MSIAPSSASTNASASKWPAPRASAVPTSTGATEAGSVRTRAAITQMRTALLGLGTPGKAGEVRLALLLVGVAALLGLRAFVEEQVRVVCELLDARQAVLGGVEARLQKPQRKRRQDEHLLTPAQRLLFEALERDDGVDEAHLQSLARGVPAAQKPDLLRLLGPHEARQQAGAEAAVEGAHARADLTEARVVGGDREVAPQVQDVAAADRIAGDHRDHRLGEAPDLDVQVGHVEAAHAGAPGGVLVEIAGVAAHALVSAGAEGVGALAREDDHAHLEVLARVLQRARDLDDRARAKGVSHLRARDRDLGDALVRRRGLLVADVAERITGAVVGGRPGDRLVGHRAKASLWRWSSRDGLPGPRRRVPPTPRCWRTTAPAPMASCWRRRAPGPRGPPPAAPAPPRPRPPPHPAAPPTTPPRLAPVTSTRQH